MVRSERALVVVLSGALACGGGSGSGSDGGAGDGGPDGGVPSVVDPSNRFATDSQEWAVPQSGLDTGFEQPDSFASYRYWSTLDVDGDRWPDIVHTGATDLSESPWDAAGSPHWKVYRGGDARWDDAAIDWKVPPSGDPHGFFAVAGNVGAGWWRTFDMTGDGLPDLVQTSDPATGSIWYEGDSPFWKVFENDGEGGFVKAPISWAVPANDSIYGFNITEYSSTTWRWTTRDVNGDRLPDFVQTSDPQTGYVWDEGSAPHWKVFLNTGEGFDSQATSWSVPDSGSTGGFYATEENGTVHWRLMDLDGDGHPDLVETADPANGAVWDAAGEPYWKVFSGESGGFASEATNWPVPPNGLGEGFYDAFAASAYRRWSVADIDGDRDLDLVQTGDVSHDYRVWDASGDPYWKVWRNDGAGFSSELYRWPVPKNGTEYGFYQVSAQDAYTTWTLLDADGDGHLDLVQTEDPSTGKVWDATGSPYWKIFAGEE